MENPHGGLVLFNAFSRLRQVLALGLNRRPRVGRRRVAQHQPCGQVAGEHAQSPRAGVFCAAVSARGWLELPRELHMLPLAVELAAQAVVTALLLLVRARGSPLQPVGLRALFAAVQRRSTLKLHFLRSSGAPSFCHQYSTGGIGLRAVAATLHLLAVRLKSLQCALL